MRHCVGLIRDCLSHAYFLFSRFSHGVIFFLRLCFSGFGKSKGSGGGIDSGEGEGGDGDGGGSEAGGGSGDSGEGI